jgi:hypothetical protein
MRPAVHLDAISMALTVKAVTFRASDRCLPLLVIVSSSVILSYFQFSVRMSTCGISSFSYLMAFIHMQSSSDSKTETDVTSDYD